MLKYVTVMLAILISAGNMEAQNLDTLLQGMFIKMDQSLSAADKQQFLQDFDTVEMYYLFAVRDEFEKLKISEWEGPFHDAVRKRLQVEFIGDNIPLEGYVARNYYYHLQGRKLVFESGDLDALRDELKRREAERMHNRDSAIASIRTGATAYMMPFLLTPPRPEQLAVDHITDLKPEVPRYEIPVTVLAPGKEEATFVVALKDDRILKKWLKEIDAGADKNKFRELMRLKKGDTTTLSYTELSAVPPARSWKDLVFISDCYTDGSQQFKFSYQAGYMVHSEANPEYAEQHVALEDNILSFEINGVTYRPNTNEVMEIIGFEDEHGKLKLKPAACNEHWQEIEEVVPAIPLQEIPVSAMEPERKQ